MKIRSGFVSNSSSSSFLIFGERVDGHELLDKWDNDIWMAGKYVGEGTDVFLLTPEMIDLIIKNGLRHRLFYKAYKTFYVEDWDTDVTGIKRDELPPVFSVYHWDKSHHSVNDLRMFIERYINEN